MRQYLVDKFSIHLPLSETVIKSNGQEDATITVRHRMIKAKTVVRITRTNEGLNLVTIKTKEPSRKVRRKAR